MSDSTLFWSSDKPLREIIGYDAVPAAVVYDCGRCGVRINKDFDESGYVHCLNGHLNRRASH